MPKLSIKLELKPEHHNPAFYETANTVTHTATDVLAEEDAEDCEEYDEDSLSNQSSSCLQNDPLASGTTTSAGTSSLLVNPAAKAAVAAAAAATNDKVRKTKSKLKSTTSTSKKTQSPAPPIATRKATSYIGVSGSLIPVIVRLSLPLLVFSHPTLESC